MKCSVCCSGSKFHAVFMAVCPLQHVQADPPTNKNLAQLVVMLLQFMEDNFGPKAPRPPMTKLPVSSGFG